MTTTHSITFATQLWTNVRLVIATMFVCCVLYTLLILGIGQTFVPFSANGYLLREMNCGVRFGSAERRMSETPFISMFCSSAFFLRSAL